MILSKANLLAVLAASADKTMHVLRTLHITKRGYTVAASEKGIIVVDSVSSDMRETARRVLATDEEQLEEIDPLKMKFPKGESYKDVEKRIRSFLNDLLEKHPGKHVAIVAHKAPQLALEVALNNKTWEQAIEEDWRKKEPKEWRPGWTYILKEGVY